MVEVASALAIEDSALVELEGGLVGLDSNGDGLLSELADHTTLALLCDGDLTGGLEAGLACRGCIVSAVTVFALVWPGCLSVHGVVLGVVFEHGAEVSTVASKAEFVAAHELLLRELLEFTVGDLVNALHGGAGGE